MEPVVAALALVGLIMILVILSLNIIERVMQENIEVEHQIDKEEQISQDQQEAEQESEEEEEEEEAEKETEEHVQTEQDDDDDTDVEAEAPDSDDSYMSLTKEEEKIVSENANKFFSYTIGELLKVRLERERREKQQ